MEDNTNTNHELDVENTQGQEKNYTKAEVDSLLQQEADRRVSAALSKQKKEYEKKLSLTNLDESQRATAEKDMRIQELQEQLSQYTVEKNRSELKSVLGSRGLSPQFADIINVGDDIEEAQARIDTLDTLFKAAVSAEVKKRMGVGTPKTGTIEAGELTKEGFIKLTLAQRSELYKDNPELFLKLSK